MCDYPDCKKGNRLPFFASCKDHQCKADKCHLTQIKASTFCKTHNKKCALNLCDKVVDNTIYCNLHRCKKIGCQNFAQAEFCNFCAPKKLKKCLNEYCFDKSYQDYCDFHRCPEPGCQNKRSPMKNYCQDHRANICKDFCCSNKIFKGEYCREHVCEEPNCSEKQDFHKPYCKKHTVGKWFCQELTCGVQLNPGEKYCLKHKCSYPGCPNEKDILSDWCRNHTRQECKIPNCYAEAKIGSSYCENHQRKTCQYPYCYRSVDFNFSSRFCSEHIPRSESGPKQNYKDPFIFDFPPKTSRNAHKPKICQATKCDNNTYKEKYCYTHKQAGLYLESKGINSKEDLKSWFRKNHPDKSEKPIDPDLFTKVRQYGKEIYPSG